MNSHVTHFVISHVLLRAALSLVVAGTIACDGGGVVDAGGDAGAPVLDAGDQASDGGIDDDDAGIGDDDAGTGEDAGVPLESFVVGGARPVEVYVPSTLQAGTPAPLVFFLHGYGVTGAVMESYLNIRAEAESRGFLYAHPDGTLDQSDAPFWNASQACCDFLQTGVDDSTYLSSLIDEIAARVDVDESRIYFMGHSNGGFMSFRMACDHASRVAAIVSIAGAMMNDVDVCDPDDTVAALHVHGTDDDTILYSGATVQGVTYPGAVETAEKWASKMGCSTTGTPGDTALDLDLAVAGTETTSVAYDDGCDPGGASALFTIAGGSHTPTPSNRFIPTLLDFLFAHVKP
jgi:polyhydroxybutyrate depolymerase